MLLHAPRGRRAALTAMVVVSLILAGCSSSTSSSGVVGPSRDTGVGQPTPFLGANLTDVSCASTSRCAAVGINFDPSAAAAPVAVSTDGGSSWHAATSSALNASKFVSVGCSERSCLAVGFALAGALVYGASASDPTWKATTRVAPSSSAEAVACNGVRWCLAIYSDPTHRWAASTIDGGSSWTSTGDLPAGAGTVTRLSCSSTTSCLSIGTTTTAAPMVLSTSDGGMTWTTATLPSSPSLTAVLGGACQDATFCVAVGSSPTGDVVLTSTDGGTTFALPARPFTALAAPLAVSCSTRSCLLVGRDSSGRGAAAQLLSSGAATPLRLSYAPTELSAVSCGSPARCVAISSSSLVLFALSVPERNPHQSG